MGEEGGGRRVGEEGGGRRVGEEGERGKRVRVSGRKRALTRMS